MTRAVTASCPDENAPIRPHWVDWMAGAYRWRASADHAELLRSGLIDWFNLRAGATTTLVKRNSHRDVWSVSCGGREYFAKYYHPQSVSDRIKLRLRGPAAMNEWRIGAYAAAHGITAVVPVAVAWDDRRGGTGTSLLVTEAVREVSPLNEYWLAVRSDPRRAAQLSEALARLIARAHQCGFQHDDMHPGNILARQRGDTCEVFFVDLHKARTARPVGMREIASNLAQLNQWFRRHATRSQRLRFLQSYLAHRDACASASPFARHFRIDTGRLTADLAVQADLHANKLWSKRDRRTARDSRYFSRIKPAPGWRGHVLLQCKHPSPTALASRLTYKKAQWKQWLREPLAWVDPAKHELLKDSHTATVCKAMLPVQPDPVPVIVKRHLPRNGWKWLLHALGPSRNRRSWKIANMLSNRDLPVAAPLMVLERYVARFVRVDSLLMTEFVQDSVDLETFLTRDLAQVSPDRQRKVKNQLIDAVVQLLKTFYERGFVHRDLKAPNLLVVWPAPYTTPPLLTFIDMDGINHVRHTTETQQLRGVVRLCASLLSSPACTASDKLRFLKQFLCGPGRTPAAWKMYWRTIYGRVCTKMADKEIRRQWKLANYGRV
ncbi:MAG: hypothetical protein HBSAPP02_25880 [Phycisphaerae bacterium]|nr:MAG: hypothetical protein HRU71_14060 [Planctomycetia bacterium]RIK67369.1 MAG: hypothetical protein DCC66_11770 [Planctomycetota bacterium]GJQ27556.1 MAG: hypothetical protein HBSAPP02_25880 [Phycisphaerae bacterium]